MIALLLALALPVFSQETFVVDRFSAAREKGGAPKDWRPFRFKTAPKETVYGVGQEQNNYYVTAVSDGAGAGLLKDARFDVKKFPKLSWRWRVRKFPEGADGKKKSADDFGARLYVSFLYEPKESGVFERLKFKAAKAKFGAFPPKWALVYVWDDKYPVGKIYDNAYTAHAKMIVVQSGPAKKGEWLSYSRDVYEDYKAAVGEDDPPPVSFIAVMTDTDNTHSSAEADYDDIVFSAK
jgi:hypothetical protein